MTKRNQRPNPDKLLAHVQTEERQQVRGRLKIFLGYAAGVGKTYAMLDAARQRKAEGIDVVAAYIETHGRVDTQTMLRDLETLPCKQVEYRGKLLSEVDVDAVLERRPQLTLVDELAHTNAPGFRHPKRYQDVDELLAAGIDVYTTLNLQHLESLKDTVEQITGVVVRETVPDRLVDEAAEIELVDLPPNELRQRLKEGKVYVPDQAARAIEKFFRTGNLTALRELSMRRTADRVDDQMQTYMQTRAIPGPWPAKERLLVCVSPSPLSERLVRSARHLADELNAEWLALYIETPDHARLRQDQREHVIRTLQLAEELGSKVITLPGHSIAETVVDYARRTNITKIIIGKPIYPRWRELLRGSVADQIIRASGPIDVHVISGTPNAGTATTGKLGVGQLNPPWKRYLQSTGLVVAGTALSALVHPFFSPTNLVMIYLLAVVLAAIYLGRGPSFLAAILSVMTFDYFFVPPRLTLNVGDTEYLLTFAALLMVSLVISSLTVRVREQADAARQRERQTAELYAVSRDLAVAFNLNEILQAVVTHISQTLSREVVILLPRPSDGRLEPRASSIGFMLDENQLAVAVWSFQRATQAGRGTDTLPSVDIRCLPLRTSHGVVGILGIKPVGQSSTLTPNQRELLQAFANQTALAVERAQLAEQAQQAELLQSAEKLRTTLLNMISHDLRTPLVSITGALSSLQEDGIEFDEDTRHNLIENACQEAERLNRLVGNLLDMTRIEAGALQINRELCDVQDVIGSSLEQLELQNHTVAVHAPFDLPHVPMDFVLMVQVLTNLLDNAVKYSRSGMPVEVNARIHDTMLEIEVTDRGIGIPPSDLVRVFDKFYRVQQPGNVIGSGLGLSICKGIIEAHGGRIWAKNREGGGTVITFALPLNHSVEKLK